MRDAWSRWMHTTKFRRFMDSMKCRVPCLAGKRGWLTPASFLDHYVLNQEAGEAGYHAGKSQQAVERLMVSRGGVIWPQLLPGDVRGGISDRLNGGSYATPLVVDRRRDCNSEQLDTFSMVEDRLLCR